MDARVALSPYKNDPDLKNRAMESMLQLRKALLDAPKAVLQPSEQQHTPSTDRGLAPTQSYSNANMLRSMLSNLPSDSAGQQHVHHTQEAVLHRCPPTDSGVPSAEETIAFLEHQSAYIEQLENELSYAKEELAAVKVKMSDIMHENVRLQSELRHNVVKEIVSEQRNSGSSVPATTSCTKCTNGGLQDKAYFGKWQQELDKISTLHKARNEALEAQLAYAKDEMHRREADAEDLRSKLRMQASLSALSSSHDGQEKHARLCTLCARNSAVAASLNSPVALSAELEEMRREKDEATDSLSRAMSQLAAMQRREEEACDRVKACIEMVEQAERDKGEVLVQREQVREELERSRRRLETGAADQQRQLAEARETARKEQQRDIDDLEIRLKHAVDGESIVKAELGRLARDKIDIEHQLGQTRLLVQQQEIAIAEAKSKLRVDVTRLSLERDGALEERVKLKSNLQKMEELHDEAVQRARCEADALRRRLDAAEHDTLTSKEECIKLVKDNQRLDKELDKVKLARSTLERSRGEEITALAGRLEQRENELSALLQTSEARHGMQKQELQTNLVSQSRLIDKLREECRRQADVIEGISSKYRQQTKHLKKDNSLMTRQLASAQQAVRRLDQQMGEHVRVHEQLREHVVAGDEAIRLNVQQNVELLSKNQEMARDLEIVSSELRLLRVYASGGDMLANGLPKPRMPVTGVIGDILTALSDDMVAQDRSILNGISIIRQATVGDTGL